MSGLKTYLQQDYQTEYIGAFNLADSTAELDALAQVILAISQHQGCFYLVQDQQDWLIYSGISSEKHFCYRLSLPSFELAEIQHFKMQDQIFISLKQVIHSIIGIKVSSITNVKVYDLQLNHPIYVVCYSDHQHVIGVGQAHALEAYLQQHQRAVQSYLEAQDIKLQMVEIEKVSKGLSKYFSVISHDLRAPFHGIIGCADILLHEADTLDEAAASRLVQYIYDTSNSTYTLLQGLLNWSMAQGGKFHLNPKHFRLNDVVQSVFDLLFASAYKKQIELSGNVHPSLFVYADMNMITSILQNLISNALKFTLAKDNRQILITADKIDDKVEIMIKDDGMGMSAHQVERFLQDSSISTVGTSGEQGMGLGLVLSKQFLAMNNGSMALTSALNEGTCITIALPLGDKDA